MATNIAKHLIRASREYVRDFQDELMRRHYEAMRVNNLEEAIEALTEVANEIASYIDSTVEQFFKNDVTTLDYNSRWKLAQCLSGLSSLVSEHVIKVASNFVEIGYDVVGLDALTDAYSQLDQSVAVLKKTCPEPDVKVLLKSKADVKRGDYLPVKEAFLDAAFKSTNG